MLPQPTSPNPRWDPALLAQTERRLAHLVGPVARLLVQRAAAATTDVDRFHRLLADRLNESDRAAFLGSRPKPAQAVASKWDPEVLKQVEHHLAIPLRCDRSEEHTSELQSLRHLVCRLLLEKK